MKRPRVLLADDHRLLREAFTQLLAADCDVVGAVADGRALLVAAGAGRVVQALPAVPPSA